MALLSGCVTTPKRPPPPVANGELLLDAAAPFVSVTLAGVPVRLRVDPGQWDRIELNPEAAARLPLAYEGGSDMAIGRTEVKGRSAQTVLVAGEASVPVLVAEHGRVADDAVDGIVGPDLLPYATIRWHRADAPLAVDTVMLPLTLDHLTGLAATAPGIAVPISLRFSLVRATSVATAAAGSLLLQRFGGGYEGPSQPIPIVLGVTRPARAIAFAAPPLLAGFRFPQLLVRLADFRGDNPLPADPAPAKGEIVVAHRDRPQAARPFVTIALDRLGRCADITYAAEPRSLTLACAFDR